MRKLFRLLVALAAFTTVAAAAYVHHAAESSGAKMTEAAERFVGSLDAEQRAKAVFDFDDKERLNWHFIPLQDTQKQPTRKGLRLERMTAEQKEAAKTLLRAGTSASGFAKATTIMSLESILRELEKGGTNVRNPEWYFFTVFGTPSKTGKWGWRVEGHHLSLNFTIDGGNVVSATPAFFGANPAIVKQGPRNGTRTLPEAEELARELFNSLDDEQKRVAYQDKQFPEIQGQTRVPKVGAPTGLAAGEMTEKQRAVLIKLLEAYANRMPAEIASAEMCEVRNAGVELIHFAYAGEPEQGKPHTYRIQGPTVLIEFLNVQADSAHNPANHIHSAWRNIKGDFGLTQ
jgi:Protein of unknown function (DUF3500)